MFGRDGLVINLFLNVSDIRFVATTELSGVGTNILKKVGKQADLFKES